MSEESEHLGDKLRRVSEELGLKPKMLADYFGMKPPSIYDTLKFGRLDKRHYQALVNLNKKPLEWWFDVTPPASEQPRATTPKAAEENGTYAAKLEPGAQELLRLFNKLPKSEQSELMQQLRSKVTHYEQLFLELAERKLS